MGASLSRGMGSFLRKLAVEIYEHVTVPKLIQGVSKAGRTVNTNSFMTRLAKICADLGQPLPPQNDISDFQTAVVDLATYLGALTKPELDQLKTVLTNKVTNRARVTPQDQDDIAFCIGRAMGWSTNRQTVDANFTAHILNPLYTFVSTIFVARVGFIQAWRLSSKCGELTNPFALAVGISDILH